MKTNGGDHKKHFERIIEGGVKVENWSKMVSKIRTTEAQPKIIGYYSKKKSVYETSTIHTRHLEIGVSCFEA